jgi:hypothetical protein
MRKDSGFIVRNAGLGITSNDEISISDTNITYSADGNTTLIFLWLRTYC